MIQKFNISRIIRERPDQRSFHVVSEEGIRIEFRNLRPKDQVGRLAYEGEVVVTCYGGLFELETDDDIGMLEDHDQIVVPRGVSIRVSCLEPGVLQFIWTPGHAPTAQS